MPLTREENARIAARGNLAAESLPAASPVSTWLPPSERHVMQEYLYRLTVSQKGVTRRVMARAAEFLPMILAELEEQGLPRELAALPLVESAFDLRTVSHAGAAGLPEDPEGLWCVTLDEFAAMDPLEFRAGEGMEELGDTIQLIPFYWRSLWADLRVPEGNQGGDFQISLSLKSLEGLNSAFVLIGTEVIAIFCLPACTIVSSV